MYSTLGQGIGYRKAEEAHKEGGNIAAQVVTKCSRVLGVTTLLALVTSVPKYTRRLDFTTGKQVDRGRILRVAKQ